MKRRSARRSSLKRRERAIVNQTSITTVSNVTLEKLLSYVVDYISGFLGFQASFLTELNFTVQFQLQNYSQQALSQIHKQTGGKGHRYPQNRITELVVHNVNDLTFFIVCWF